MVVNAPLHRANISPVKPGLPAANDNSIIQQRIANHCNFVAQVFATVAELRDQGIDPVAVIKAMKAAGDELPAELKDNAEDIVLIVYGVLADTPPAEVGAAVFGQCMRHNTGIQRQA